MLIGTGREPKTRNCPRIYAYGAQFDVAYTVLFCGASFCGSNRIFFLVPKGRAMSGEQLQQLKERFPDVPMATVVSLADDRLVLTSLWLELAVA